MLFRSGFAAKADFTTGSNPYQVAVRDLNGDGLPDYVVAEGGANAVSLYLGNGAGGVTTKTSFPTGANPASVAIWLAASSALLTVSSVESSV